MTLVSAETLKKLKLTWLRRITYNYIINNSSNYLFEKEQCPN